MIPVVRARWAARASNVALALGSVLVLLALSEAALRFAGWRPDPYWSTYRMVDARWTMLLDCFPSNPRGYFEIDLRTDESRRQYGHVAPWRYDRVVSRAPWAVEFRYNNLRFRDKPFGPKPKGVTRIMVLGDSFTEGQGVKEQDTLVRVLGRLLEAAEPGRYEVLNCGHRRADFPELFETFESILAFDPDLLIYAMVLNDPEQSAPFHARQTYVDDWILARGRDLVEPPVEEPGLLESRLRLFVSSRLVGWRIRRETTRWYLEMVGPENAEGWEKTRGYIREMDRRMRSRGGRMLLVVWPLLVGLEGRYPFSAVHEKIARFCLASGIERRDLLDLLRGRESATLWVHPVDRHPNEVAHRLAAEWLLPLVREQAAPGPRTAAETP